MTGKGRGLADVMERRGMDMEELNKRIARLESLEVALYFLP